MNLCHDDHVTDYTCKPSSVAGFDMMIASHLAFVPAIVIAAGRSPGLPELVALQSAVLALSVGYHRNCECDKAQTDTRWMDLIRSM